MLERTHSELPLAAQAELLSLSRSSLYYEPLGPSAKEIAIKHRIDEIYTKHPIYGSRRMTAVLCREGWSISRPTVQGYMREMGIAGIAPGPNTSQPSPEHKIFTPTCCVTWKSAAKTRFGGLISPTFACGPDGCTWWPFWTGLAAMW